MAASVALLLLVGCRNPSAVSLQQLSSADELRANLPKLQQRRQTSTLPELGPEPKLSGTFQGTIDELVQFVGSQGVILGFAQAVEEDDDGQRVFRVRWGGGVDASTALKVVADQLGGGALVLRRGVDVYMIGQPDSRDFEARILRLTSEQPDQFKEAIQALASDKAQVQVVGDSIVVKDTPAGMRVVDDLYEGLVAARGQWVVEVRFVELTRSAAETLGIDFDLSGAVGLALGGGFSGLTVTDLLTANLNGLIKADATEEHIRTLTTARLHVIEGDEAMLQVGDTIPIPTTRSVSDQGTVTQDFEDVDTGVLLRVMIRTEPDGRLRVLLEPELSDVTGFVEGRPIRSRRRLKTAAVIEPGGSLLAGGFSQNKGRHTRDGLPQLLDRSVISSRDLAEDDTRIFVMVRVYDPLAAIQPVEAGESPPATARPLIEPGVPSDDEPRPGPDRGAIRGPGLLDRDMTPVYDQIIAAAAPQG